MTPTSATQERTEQATDKTAIRPFRFEAPEADLIELRRRIKATRFPERETVTDFSQGVQLTFMQALARLLGNRLQLAQGRGEAELVSQFPHRDRRPRYPFHAHSFTA